MSATADVAEMQDSTTVTASSSLDSSPSSSEDSMDRLLLPGGNAVSSQSSRSSLTDSSTSTDASSSSAPTIPSILKSSSAFSLASSSTVTISFAPLPDLAPRKRKSTVQLGVAARSNMLRSRRMYLITQEETLRMQNEEQEGISVLPLNSPPPLMGSPTSESSVMYVHGGTRGPNMATPGGWSSSYSDQLPKDPGLAEDAVEDAFLALGRAFKGAGRTLWRKMSVSKLRTSDELARDRAAESEKRSIAAPGSYREDKTKKQGSKGRRSPKGWSSDDMTAVLASEEGGRDVLSLRALLNESIRPSGSLDAALEADEEVADIVLSDPNAPHPSEHIDLPGPLPADFLNITQPSDEPCPPTALPDLADDTDSDTSHSTTGQSDLPATPPTEFESDSDVADDDNA
ncbi:hypothetical protein EUX98_g5983 [Antrodiella citrinella]|uniref:Uncharacterized protein n=1 Tax=Antrodiella citrinella TaxID=2447956 RepID=A0A4S4MSQ9_9APHY|nr:hypothetical protein EUX98_g5983 [Antrodiella citrinella]